MGEEKREFVVETFYLKGDERNILYVNGKEEREIPDYVVEGNSLRKCPYCGKREGLAMPPCVYEDPIFDGIAVETEVKCFSCGLVWKEITHIEKDPDGEE